MAYTDQHALALDAVFQSRVKVAMATAGIAIVGEAQAAMSTQETRKRQKYGIQVLNDLDGHLDTFAFAVTQNAAIVTGSTDDDIQFTVNSVWNDLAGVLEDD